MLVACQKTEVTLVREMLTKRLGGSGHSNGDASGSGSQGSKRKPQSKSAGKPPSEGGAAAKQ